MLITQNLCKYHLMHMKCKYNACNMKIFNRVEKILWIFLVLVSFYFYDHKKHRKKAKKVFFQVLKLKLCEVLWKVFLCLDVLCCHFHWSKGEEEENCKGKVSDVFNSTVESCVSTKWNKKKEKRKRKRNEFYEK